MAQRIVINGQAFDSPAAMPPEVRQQYEAALRLAGATRPAGASIQHHVIVVVNGKTITQPSDLPPEAHALLERLRTSAAASGGSRTDIVVNGTHYPSVDAMPAEVRAEYDRALSALASTGAAGGVEAAAVRQMLRLRSPDEGGSRVWRGIGWLIVGALALMYWWTDGHLR